MNGKRFNNKNITNKNERKTEKNEDKTNRIIEETEKSDVQANRITEENKKSARTNKKRGGKAKRIITTILLLFFIILMLLSGTKIVMWVLDNAKNKEIINELSNFVMVDENNRYNVDFEKLKEENSDTVAWLKVNGTNIEYPVVKSDNNDYYLTRSFDKSYNTAGWIFMDCNNEADGTDKNAVIYGHNRRDGSMFGSLKNILTDEWKSNEENFTIQYITENGEEEYQVFSVYSIEKEDYYITTAFNSNKDFSDFINNIKSRSEKDFNIDVNSEDHILTLSTCANDNKYRVVLHAKRK